MTTVEESASMKNADTAWDPMGQLCADPDGSGQTSGKDLTKDLNKDLTKDLTKVRNVPSQTICLNFLNKGKCSGSNCQFTHASSELRHSSKTTICKNYHQKNLQDYQKKKLTFLRHTSKTTICKNFMEGRCKRKDCNYAHGEAELAIVPSTKKKSCPFFKQGECRNGVDCDFVHDLKFTRTVLCTNFMKGSCTNQNCTYAHGEAEIACRNFLKGSCKNQDCPYVHGEAELVKPPSSHGEAELAEPPGLFKNKTCPWFKQGKCWNGAKCSFVHEYRKNKPCPWFKQGKCRNGDDCTFLHDSSQSVAEGEPFKQKPLKNDCEFDYEASTNVPSSLSQVESDITTRSTGPIPQENLFRMLAGQGAAPIQQQVKSMSLAIGDLQAKLCQMQGGRQGASNTTDHALQKQVDEMELAMKQLSSEVMETQPPANQQAAPPATQQEKARIDPLLRLRPLDQDKMAQSTPAFLGAIKSFNMQKGWGHIECEETQELFGRKDTFLLRSQLHGIVPVEGDQVYFDVIDAKKGPEATNVQFLRPVYMGIVKSWTPGFRVKGWGHIECEATHKLYGKDIFVMRGSMSDGGLSLGDRVSFSVQEGTKGVEAINVTIIESQSPKTTGFEQTPSQCFVGSIKSFDEEKGWGHIACDETRVLYGKDMFLLRTQLNGIVPVEGDQVYFDVTDGKKGLEATNVQILGKAQLDRHFGMLKSWNPVKGWGHVECEATHKLIGILKSWNPVKGWGDVECEATHKLYGKDVFVMRGAMSAADYHVGDRVCFSVQEGTKGVEAINVTIIASQGPKTTGFEQTPSQCFVGSIQSFDEEKGWGDIACDETWELYGRDMFVLREAFRQQTVTIGQQVCFTVGMGAKSKGLQAQNVRPVSNANDHVMETQLHANQQPAPPVTQQLGTVKGYNPDKGFGFISAADGSDVFLHIKDCADAGIPQKGDVVAYDVAESQVKPGQMQASNITGGTGVKGAGKGCPPGANSGQCKSFNAPVSRQKKHGTSDDISWTTTSPPPPMSFRWWDMKRAKKVRRTTQSLLVENSEGSHQFGLRAALCVLVFAVMVMLELSYFRIPSASLVFALVVLVFASDLHR